MPAVKIVYSSRFARSYKKLPTRVKRVAEKRERIFRRDPFDPRLKTHKLKGGLVGHWSFSITYSYRIVFRFASKDRKIVYWDDVGNHSVYR